MYRSSPEYQAYLGEKLNKDQPVPQQVPPNFQPTYYQVQPSTAEIKPYNSGVVKIAQVPSNSDNITRLNEILIASNSNYVPVDLFHSLEKEIHPQAFSNNETLPILPVNFPEPEGGINPQTLTITETLPILPVKIESSISVKDEEKLHETDNVDHSETEEMILPDAPSSPCFPSQETGSPQMYKVESSDSYQNVQVKAEMVDSILP